MLFNVDLEGHSKYTFYKCKKKEGYMRKLNLAEGSLVLLGFILILNAVIFKVSGLNLLPIIKKASNFVMVANTCFLMALISAIFENPEK